MFKMKQAPIGRQVLLAFVAICLILIAIGALLFFSLKVFDERNREHQLRASSKVELVNALAQNSGMLQVAVLRSISLSDEVGSAVYEKTIQDLDATIIQELAAYEKIITSEQEKLLFEWTVRRYRSYGELTKSLLALSKISGTSETASFVVSRQAPAYDDYQRAINGLVRCAGQQAAEVSVSSSDLISQTRTLANLAITLAILIVIGAGISVTQVARRLRKDNTALQGQIAERRRADEVLRESEDRYRRLVELSPNAIFIACESKIAFVNQAAMRLLGASRPEEIVGRQVMDFIHPNYQKLVADRIRTLHRNWLEAPAVALKYLRLNGSIVDVEAASAPFIFQGKPAAQVILNDIAKRKRAEKVQQATYEISQAIHTTRDLNDFYQEIRRILGRLMPTNNLYIALYDRATDTVSFPFFVDQIDGNVPPPSRKRGRGLTEYVLRTGTALHVNGEEYQAMIERGELELVGAQSLDWLGVPLKIKGRTIGVMALQSYLEGVRFTEDDTEILQFVSGQIAIALERKQAQEALRESQSLYHSLVEHLPVNVYRKDKEGRFIFVNSRFCQFKGRPAKELLGKTVFEFSSPEVARQFTEKDRAVLETGEVLAVEEEIHQPDGKVTYLHTVKSPVFNSTGTIIGTQGMFFDITERKQAQEALRESDERFRQLAENIADTFWMTSPDSRKIYYVSPAYERIWGHTLASLQADPSQRLEAILPEDRERVVNAFASLAINQPSINVEYRIKRPDGTIRWINDRGFQVRDPENRVVRLTGIATDITERKQLEDQLFQSQKMETVGKLAGGIAHEFNSILTAIIGQSELLLRDLPFGDRLSKKVTEIRKAADRAAELTRELLAYGRKQILRPEILDLNQIIANMEGMFSHLMGTTVDVRIVPANDLQAVRADAGQIEQVIMNMAMNARDAMPAGGKLTLETTNVTFDAENVSRYPELGPGQYVMLSITDTGIGMSGEVKAHAFEPFFSTKDVGQGTGLGLATCYGIVKQSGGHISVDSELGKGTTFKIYLPQVEGEKLRPQEQVSLDLPRGTETIMLVEDDSALREMATDLLGRLGYRVLAAANGKKALSLIEQRNDESIDLLCTDVAMAEITGKELSDRIGALYPQTKTLFTSAYTEKAIDHPGVMGPRVALLQKPFTPSALARKLRDVLDAKEDALVAAKN